jgi:hypothetical protein
MSLKDEMQNRIDKAAFGSAFIVSDFTDMMDYETAKKNLTRFEKEGMIRRVMRGVYDKPRYSNLLQENAVPNPEEVAKAIARNYNWTIAPTGDAALNLLGISTQVPSKWEYVSSGPYKEYNIEGAQISFLHRADSVIFGMSYKSALVVQTLKKVGRESTDDHIINNLRMVMTDEEIKTLEEDGRQSLPWIYSVIKQIAAGGKNNV